MKYITLLALLFFGFNNSVYSQIDLENEIAKGSSLEITEGTTLVYGVNYFGNEYDIIFIVKSLNEEVVFDYEGLNERNKKGTVKISKKALEFARAQNNYYHDGGTRDLQNQTSIWVSDLVFNELIKTGEVVISTDAGASQVTLQNSRVGHDFKIANNGTNANISYVYAESTDGKVKYWLSLNEDNPIVLKMEMGWSIWLKEIKTN